MPEILVIIVTYNGEKWIRRCLDHLAGSTQPVKTVVVDNGSTDHTKRIISEGFPDVMLLEEDQNHGFGQANNIALAYALQQQTDYVLLLNQDAYVYPGTIGTLLSVAEKHPEYGIISPLQQNGSGGQLDVQFRIFIANNYPEAFVKKVEAREGDLPELFPVRFVNAAAWFIPRSCLERTGLFHPLFYHYGEDNNYCSRVQYHGFKTGITPLAAIRHDRTQTGADKKQLERQIAIVPLYILLDLRKKIVLAYLLAFWKLVGYLWKGIKQKSPDICRLTFSEIKWVVKNTRRIADARRTTKAPYVNKAAVPKTAVQQTNH
jgi:GT2 family glycosyltransferase